MNNNRTVSELTIKDVDTAIRILASEAPDYVYNHSSPTAGCFYDRGVRGGPESKGCIFGQAFQRLGVDMSTVGGADIASLWYDTHEGLPVDASHCPEEWSAVQYAQDNGGRWGEAIQHLKPVPLTNR